MYYSIDEVLFKCISSLQPKMWFRFQSNLLKILTKHFSIVLQAKCVQHSLMLFNGKCKLNCMSKQTMEEQHLRLPKIFIQNRSFPCISFESKKHETVRCVCALTMTFNTWTKSFQSLRCIITYSKKMFVVSLLFTL